MKHPEALNFLCFRVATVYFGVGLGMALHCTVDCPEMTIAPIYFWVLFGLQKRAPQTQSPQPKMALT